tara:strand:+ start:6083 stop:6787 length:705 start_codon:yes stop_codon:yes gene_type:complete
VKILTFMLIVFFSLKAELTFGAASLKTHIAEYEVNISIITGILRTELKKNKENYIAHHIIEPSNLSKMITRGTLDVTSEFQVTVDHIKPVRFKAIDTIRNKPEINLLFDWENYLVKGAIGKELVQFTLNDIAYDNVSIQYELMNDLLTGNLQSQYTLFDINELKIASISTTGKKLIKTIAGNFTTVGIKHQKIGSSQITTLWCAEELDYLPVVIEQHRKGKLKFRASLTKYVIT